MKFLQKLLVVGIFLAMIAAGALFAAANDAPVPLDLLFYTLKPQSLALWVLGAFALGGLAGMLVSSFIMFRQRASLSVSRRQLEKTRVELAQLRDANPAAESA